MVCGLAAVSVISTGRPATWMEPSCEFPSVGLKSAPAPAVATPFNACLRLNDCFMDSFTLLPATYTDSIVRVLRMVSGFVSSTERYAYFAFCGPAKIFRYFQDFRFSSNARHALSFAGFLHSAETASVHLSIRVYFTPISGTPPRRDSMIRASAQIVGIMLALSFASSRIAAQSQDANKPKLYNTAKQKLLDGKQVFSFTQSKFDIAGYCERRQALRLHVV